MSAMIGSAQAHRRLLADADLRPGMRVLDVGCGTATLSLLAAHTQPAASVVGLDQDRRALDRARSKALDAGRDLRFDVGLAGSLPYEDASMDRVLSAFVLHHLPDGQRRGSSGP